MLEKIKEIIEEQLNIEGVEITEETRSRRILTRIRSTCSSLWTHSRRSTAWRSRPRT